MAKGNTQEQARKEKVERKEAAKVQAEAANRTLASRGLLDTSDGPLPTKQAILEAIDRLKKKFQEDSSNLYAEGGQSRLATALKVKRSAPVRDIASAYNELVAVYKSRAGNSSTKYRLALIWFGCCMCSLVSNRISKG